MEVRFTELILPPRYRLPECPADGSNGVIARCAMTSIIAVGTENWHEVRECLADDVPSVRQFLFRSFSVLVAHRSLKAIGVA
jgi:hypothetical protein